MELEQQVCEHSLLKIIALEQKAEDTKNSISKIEADVRTLIS